MRRRCFFNSDKIPSTSMLSSSRLEKVDFLSRQGSLSAEEGFLFGFQNKTNNQTSPGIAESFRKVRVASPSLMSEPSAQVLLQKGSDWTG